MSIQCWLTILGKFMRHIYHCTSSYKDTYKHNRMSSKCTPAPSAETPTALDLRHAKSVPITLISVATASRSVPSVMHRCAFSARHQTAIARSVHHANNLKRFHTYKNDIMLRTLHMHLSRTTSVANRQIGVAYKMCKRRTE